LPWLNSVNSMNPVAWVVRLDVWEYRAKFYRNIKKCVTTRSESYLGQ
jgi:hypothetical protein